MKNTEATPSTAPRYTCRNCGGTIKYINPRGAAGWYGWVHIDNNEWCGYEQITRAQKLIVK